jgi:hypothetical protein
MFFFVTSFGGRSQVGSAFSFSETALPSAGLLLPKRFTILVKAQGGEAAHERITRPTTSLPLLIGYVQSK